MSEQCLWDQPGVPHTGWDCTYVADLGPVKGRYAVPGNGGTCDMCNNNPLRYLHYMIHDDFPRELAVGCVCAGKMTGDPEGALQREKNLRLTASRRAHWLKRRWRVSAKGNHYIMLNGHNLVVYPRGANWSFGIDGTFSKRVYPTRNAAKLGLFDACNGKLQTPRYDENSEIPRRNGTYGPETKDEWWR